MAVSRTEAERDGMKGRGLTLLHYYGDLLWALGDKTPPNPGFTPTRIFPLGGGGGDGAGAAAAQPDDSSSSGEEEEEDAGGAAPMAAAVGGLSLEEGGGGSGDAGAATAGRAAPVDMDAQLEAAAIAGLHTLKTAELPIQLSDFYTRHMLPTKPEGARLLLLRACCAALGLPLAFNTPLMPSAPRPARRGVRLQTLQVQKAEQAH